jgi:hypothetical protein
MQSMSPASKQVLKALLLVTVADLLTPPFDSHNALKLITTCN